ncbi:MAG: SDR family oxidoreductase [Anaerolineae bacterium]|nr:SDR family oxidoreductase [Anaerolineae bacterium]
MDLKLKDKIALVTGASRGLGYATAHTLAAEGAKIALNSRDPQKLNKAAQQIALKTGADVYPLPGDVSHPNIPAQIIQQTVSHYGGLDILIANAGGPPTGPFETFDDDTWQKAVELCFLSQVRLIRAALPFLRKSSSAAVLTVTSIAVKQPVPNLILSNSIRSATAGLTKSLALELGHEGIRFNSILPGWTETERVIDLMQYRAKTNNTTVEEEIKKQAQDSPFKRLAQPQEFANVAAFLVSPAASYITGIMLSVDGGMYKGMF